MGRLDREKLCRRQKVRKETKERPVIQEYPGNVLKKPGNKYCIKEGVLKPVKWMLKVK